MKRNRHLRLSLFTVPELSIGRAPLTPQNSQFDPRRLHYLEGMVAYLNSLFDNLQKHHSRAEALSRLEKVLPQLPYSELAQIDGNGKLLVTEIPGARNRIVFSHERLKIALLDGLRRRSESAAIPAGRYSPDVSRIISKLSRGISEEALARLLGECEVDLSSVIESLRDLGFIEETDPSAQIVPR